MRPLILLLFSAGSIHAQRNAIDWPFAANDAQRTGWEKSDSSITKDNVKDFQLVMKMSLDPSVKGLYSISPPVVLGRIISYRGFKELAFVQGASDHLWAIDADMNRVFWEKQFEKPEHPPKNTGPNANMCAAMVTAMPSLMPPPTFSGRPAGGAPPTAAKTLLNSGGFGGARPAFAISGDGKLHLMNTSTGEDVSPALPFLPAGSKASNLTVNGGVAYTATVGGCGGAASGVWAIDLNAAEPKATSYDSKSGDIRALTFGTTGTVFAQTPVSLVALEPKELKEIDAFTPPSGLAAASPVVFTWKTRELIAAAGKNGAIFVLDPKSLKTPLSETAPAGEIIGGLSSWQDTDGTRWVLAPVQGPKGAIAAYRLSDANGVPTLTQAWVSRELTSPLPPVITSGIVFALAAGNSVSGHATLFAFDGTTGKELYNTGDQVSAPATLTGVTLANGRVFFTTTDGTLYGFGIYLER